MDEMKRFLRDIEEGKFPLSRRQGNFMRMEDTPALRRRVRFFSEFSGLAFDDPEDEFNDLIAQLRSVAIKYFDDEEKKDEPTTP